MCSADYRDVVCGGVILSRRLLDVVLRFAVQGRMEMCWHSSSVLFGPAQQHLPRRSSLSASTFRLDSPVDTARTDRQIHFFGGELSIQCLISVTFSSRIYFGPAADIQLRRHDGRVIAWWSFWDGWLGWRRRSREHVGLRPALDPQAPEPDVCVRFPSRGIIPSKFSVFGEGASSFLAKSRIVHWFSCPDVALRALQCRGPRG
ncbi:hypothetical protein C8R43DRAFT_131925 [Mycena crocata]|nr:hypothetical protein C8R43DRAFT_131925 [Mycena crocata]